MKGKGRREMWVVVEEQDRAGSRGGGATLDGLH